MATLYLKVISFQSELLGQNSTVSFDENGGTFGRSKGCAWRLPDEDRYLSGQHGMVYFQEDAFYVMDTSTNGILFAGDSEPLGKGSAKVLQHGDVLKIGNYEISVSIDKEHVSSVAEQSDDLSGAADSSDQDVFGGEITDRKFDPLADEPPAKKSSFSKSTSQEDHSSGLNDYFVPPSAKKSPEKPREANPRGRRPLIPENWDHVDPPIEPTSDISPFSGVSGGAEPSGTFPNRSVSSVSRSADPYHGFLKGAGLQNGILDDADKTESLELFGRLFRNMVETLMELLRSRSELKGEFRLNRTTIRSNENNPLKFTPDVEDALGMLFGQKKQSYLGPEEAISEAIGDVQGHQIAMIVGMEAAFAALMGRLAPDNFADREQEANPLAGAIKSLNRKSTAWDNYQKFYRDNVVESGNAFGVLFGEEFSKAYEEQVRKLGDVSVKK